MAIRVVVQRVKEACVTVEGEKVGEIGRGLLLLVGFTHTDSEETLRYMAEKIVHLRLFEDESNKMNLSVLDIGGEILSVSQFTLYGDARKGRRPNYMLAAPPVQAEPLYHRFNQLLERYNGSVQTGRFGAAMEVRLLNDGPVTIILENPVK